MVVKLASILDSDMNPVEPVNSPISVYSNSHTYLYLALVTFYSITFQNQDAEPEHKTPEKNMQEISRIRFYQVSTECIQIDLSNLVKVIASSNGTNKKQSHLPNKTTPANTFPSPLNTGARPQNCWKRKIYLKFFSN